MLALKPVPYIPADGALSAGASAPPTALPHPRRSGVDANSCASNTRDSGRSTERSAWSSGKMSSSGAPATSRLPATSTSSFPTHTPASADAWGPFVSTAETTTRPPLSSTRNPSEPGVLSCTRTAVVMASIELSGRALD